MSLLKDISNQAAAVRNGSITLEDGLKAVVAKASMTPKISPLLPSVSETTGAIKNIANSGGTKESILKEAEKLAPENISNAIKSGANVLTSAQQLFAKGQTDPSRLPKTAAIKDAEQKLLIPQGGNSTSQTIDSSWLTTDRMIIGAVVISVLIVVFVLMKK